MQYINKKLFLVTNLKWQLVPRDFFTFVILWIPPTWAPVKQARMVLLKNSFSRRYSNLIPRSVSLRGVTYFVNISAKTNLSAFSLFYREPRWVRFIKKYRTISWHCHLKEYFLINQAGLGVYWGEDHQLNVSKPVSGQRQTNNTADIQVKHQTYKALRPDPFGSIAVYFFSL